MNIEICTRPQRCAHRWERIARFTIEPLEARIAPASLAISYLDIDGDAVNVTASKPGPVTPPLDGSEFTLTGGASGHLSLLDLTEAGFDGASIVFTVTKAAKGNGLADVTRINAGTNDLVSVVVKGDLAEIDAGSGTAGTPAIASLNVRSMGLYGNGNVSDLFGALGSFKVTADMRYASINVFGGAFATIGSVNIGGSLVGGTGDQSGRISADGIGAVRVGGDVLGGAGRESGTITTDNQDLGNVSIGGSLIGGTNLFSGNLSSAAGIGVVKIGRDVKGSFGESSGVINAGDEIASVTVGGSLLGGQGQQSGLIAANNLGAVIIGRDVRGGSEEITGAIRADFITSVQIGGSLVGGSGFRSGEILASEQLGTVRVVHDVKGGAGIASGFIQCLEGAIASVSIGGSLVGGSGLASGLIEGQLKMGPVTIGGDVQGGTGIDSGQLVTVEEGLGSVTIGGSILGGPAANSGKIASSFTTGVVKIGGSIVGGAGDGSGQVDSAAFMKSVTVGGSLVGGGGIGAGAIRSGGDLEAVQIGRSVIGGSGVNTGVIFCNDDMTAVTVGGSVVGGTGTGSGVISAAENLGAVKIGGDLKAGGGASSGRVASDGAEIASVSVGGSLVGGSAPDSGRISSLNGIGPVRIARDVRGGGDGSGAIETEGDLTSVAIGGSLHGGAGSESGSVRSTLDLGAVTIGRDVRGGAGANSGTIATQGKLTSVTVGGSLVGGSASGSGGIGSALALGPVKIGRDVLGGTASNAGSIITFDTLTSLTIGGSLVGGTAIRTGYVGSVGDMGAVVIGGNVFGGNMDDNDPTLDRTGFLEAERIASVTIGGSMIAGINTNLFEELTNNASIRVADDIGAIVVKGSLVGRKTQNGYTPVIISARGQETPGATSDLAIKSLSVAGRVEWSLILGGFDQDDPIEDGTNGNASIGPVSVGGDWIASSIAAGVQAQNNAGFGRAGDTVIGGATLISRIASILIGGTVAGDVRPEDHFGFVARQIGSFKAGAYVAPLTPATDAAIDLSLFTADVTIREV